MNLLREKLRACGHHLAQGGKSSSSSATSSTSTSIVTDRRTVADNGAVVVGDGGSANVTVTDLGAIQAAANLAEQAVTGSAMVASKAAEQSGKALDTAIGAAGDAVKEIKSAYSAATDAAQGTRTLAVVGLIVAAVVALSAFERKRKAA